MNCLSGVCKRNSIYCDPCKMLKKIFGFRNFRNLFYIREIWPRRLPLSTSAPEDLKEFVARGFTILPLWKSMEF